MKRISLYGILLVLLLAWGCKKDEAPRVSSAELNLPIGTLCADPKTFHDLLPYEVPPSRFYEECKKNTFGLSVIAMDAQAIEKVQKDGKLETIFRPDLAYIVRGYKDSIRNLYDQYKGNTLSTFFEKGDQVCYRVYPDGTLKVVTLEGETAKDPVKVLLILNQLYHTKTANAFNEWFIRMKY